MLGTATAASLSGLSLHLQRMMDIYIHNGCFLCEDLDPYDPASPFLTVNNSGCGNR